MSNTPETRLAAFAAQTLASSERLIEITKTVLADHPDTDISVVETVKRVLECLEVVARMNAKATVHAIELAELNDEMVQRLNVLIEKHL